MPQGNILEDDFLVSAAGKGDRTEDQQQQFDRGLIGAGVVGKNQSTPSGRNSGERQSHARARRPVRSI
jgi:hypothetical protein